MIDENSVVVRIGSKLFVS